MRGLVAALLTVLLVGVGTPARGADGVIREVRVRGNLRVEEGLILQEISSRAGEPHDPVRVRDDIRAVYTLGYFEDIIVEWDDQKGTLTFVVLEFPALRDWKVEGIEHLDQEDVDKAIPLKRREIVDPARIETGARAIEQLYHEKGYYMARVTQEVITIPDGKNQVDVVFRAEEGEKVQVRDLHLMGVRQVEEGDLRKVLATREAGFWSWFSDAGTFKEQDLERDRDVIRSFYLNHGFVDARVGDPLVQLTADRKGLRINIPVEEGESYQVGKIAFSGDLEFGEAELEEIVQKSGMVEGELFRSDNFRKAHGRITDRYADVGYAFAEVDPRTDIDREKRIVDVDFRIHKGDLVYIGRIEVKGNVKTHDRIVRREMRLAEGELYRGTAIQKSRQKIQNLGFFESVNLATHRRPGTNLVDVEIEVVEKPTGSFSIGAGYSSVDKIIGMVSVSQRNFLGRAYQLSLQANVGTSSATYNLTFNNPRVFDSNIYAGIDLYRSNRDYYDYDKEALGGALKLGTSLGDDWRTRWIYGLEQADVTNIDASASTIIKDQSGKTVTSSLTALLTYDTKDNPWEPHQGTSAEWSVEWAGGPLQGDNAFLKYGFDTSHYVPLWWDHVLVLHGRIGFIHRIEEQPLPLYELYVLGGLNSLRGFDNRSVGPKDPETGDVIGGDKELLFNVEYLFPLIKEAKVRGVLFFDTGNAWAEGERYLETSLRRSAGGGVRWFSPMGPLRLEYGFVLDQKKDEPAGQWEFSVGGFF